MFIGDKKYACSTCIKGHRSSSCTHSDRPLIEVKKKGRPVTQCEHCRDLRKTKQVHIKCVCINKPDKVEDACEENPRRKKARTSPPAPTFPNGLSDVPPSAVVRSSVRPKREPNTCSCDQTGECYCASQAKPAGAAAGDSDLMSSLILAAEAKLSPTFSEPRLGAQSPSTQQHHMSAPYTAAASSTTARGSCCNPSPELSDAMDSSPAHGSPAGSSTFNFPPMSQELASVFQCCCGATCACPGCTEHRGIDALASSESCPTSCSSCFDCTVSSPAIHQWIESTAATLPHPPASRKAFGLDPHNMHVYSPIVWQNEDAARANGLVKVPALCCGGKCGCPPNACSCLDDCCGCCSGCACPEHETMPHYSGYQGTFRCSYQVSGERASCCTGEDSDGSSPPPESSFLSSTPFSFSASPPSSATNTLMSSFHPHQQQQHMQSLSGPSSPYASTAYRRPTYSTIPPPPRAATPPDSPLPRVPFQPAPGAFTLGQPNPQLFNSSNSLQGVYHPPGPPGGYHSRDPRHTLERVRG